MVAFDESKDRNNALQQSLSETLAVDDLTVDERDEQHARTVPEASNMRKQSNAGSQDSGKGDYVSQIRNLIKSSGIYALSSFAAPLIALVLAPFLTHHLSRADYGALAILNTFIALMTGVTQLGLNAAFFRAYGYDYESKRDRLDVVSTFLMLLVLASLPVVALMIATAPSLALFLLNAPWLSSAVRASALVILVQNLTLPGLFWLRADSRTLFFSILSIINLLASAVATILFVGMMNMGVDGAILAIGVGYTIIVFCTFPVVLLRVGIHLRFDVARGMLVFGLPHVLSLIAGWVLQLLDRYLLGILKSLPQTASYAVAYSLGAALSAIIIAPFSMAWWVLMYSIAKKDNAEHIFQLIFRWFTLFLLFAAFGLSIFGVVVLNLFFPPSYHSAAPVIPIVALSMVFYGAYIVFMLGPSLTRKTWLLTVSVGSSALLNTVLNFILIPLYGAMGAAMATLIAYIALAVISYIVSQRVYSVSFEIGRFSFAVLIGSALYLGGSFLVQSQAVYIAWIIRIASLVLYGICLALLGKLPVRSYKSISIRRNLNLKSTPLINAPVVKDHAQDRTPYKVCLHVLRDARHDVRALRASTALIQAGLAVSVIDVQHDRLCPAKEDVQEGIHMNHLLIPGWYTSRRSNLGFFLIALWTFILSIVRLMQSRADIYHASELTALPACYIVAALRRKPLVYEAYELPIPYPETSVAFWHKSAKFLKHFLAFVLPRCAGVIATSPFHARELQKHFHLKKEVCLVRNIPPYKFAQKSDRLRQSLDLNPDTRIALYQGYIQANRRLDKLVHAARFLDKNIVIVLMGKDNDGALSELESIIDSEKITDRVKIIPPVPYEELLDWTASADIGLNVLSADYSLHIQLCLPNKIFEYLMAGVPVLSTQLDAVEAIIQAYDCGQIISSTEPEHIGLAINTMLADHEGLTRMRRNALAAAECDLNWEKESNQLTKLYHKILAGHKDLEALV